MRDYVREYPNATLDEFHVAYAKLDPKRHQVHTLCLPFRTLTDTSGPLGL